MESSRRDLLNDVPERSSILINNQNTHYPRFGFTPKTDIELPKTGVSLLLCITLVCDKCLGLPNNAQRRISIKPYLRRVFMLAIQNVFKGSIITVLQIIQYSLIFKESDSPFLLVNISAILHQRNH